MPECHITKSGHEPKLGAQILDGFLSGFGAKAPEIVAEFGKAVAVDFAFKRVERSYIDIGSLGHMLAGIKLDLSNPANKIFVDGYALCIIDSVIRSRSFSIRVHEWASTRGKISLSSILDTLAKLNVDIKVSSGGKSEVIFEGSQALGFAFSCVQVALSNDGSVTSLPPLEKNIIMDRGLRPDYRDRDNGINLHRQLLTSAPEMISFE